jgi:hypothetical protein
MTAFVQPVSTWHPPAQAGIKPGRPQEPPQPAEPDWCDLAAEERWAEAIISFLRTDWRKTFPLWTVINSVVAESRQQTRFDMRNATFEVLQEVMRRRRVRVIFRFKRKWIAIMDSGQPIIPLEDLRRRCGKLERA